ncbi:hypothetical protein PROP_03322 [Propionicimonas sp. T2.31MG-18]|uniref:hypothetical protein n=1 Tax=Propionicimonas sp. T2.31MG-18 TaxID=3157620 RepID=UPI0035E8C2BF
MARTSLRDTLPQVIVAGAGAGPLPALLAAGDGMHQPVGAVLDHLEGWFDPMRAPDAMVCYLASWVDLDWLTLPESPTRARSTLPGGAAPLRDLLCASADLAARRGTVGGIVRFLEVATRRTGFAVEDAGGFHLRVRLPEGGEDLADTVARIVAATKPAHVTAEVLAAGAPATDISEVALAPSPTASAPVGATAVRAPAGPDPGPPAPPATPPAPPSVPPTPAAAEGQP